MSSTHESRWTGLLAGLALGSAVTAGALVLAQRYARLEVEKSRRSLRRQRSRASSPVRRHRSRDGEAFDSAVHPRATHTGRHPARPLSAPLVPLAPPASTRPHAPVPARRPRSLAAHPRAPRDGSDGSDQSPSDGEGDEADLANYGDEAEDGIEGIVEGDSDAIAGEPEADVDGLGGAGGGADPYGESDAVPPAAARHAARARGITGKAGAVPKGGSAFGRTSAASPAGANGAGFGNGHANGPYANGNGVSGGAPGPASPSRAAKQAEAPAPVAPVATAVATPVAAATAAARSPNAAAAGPLLAPPPLGGPAAAPSGSYGPSAATAREAGGRTLEEASLHEAYVRVVTPEPAPSEETEDVCSLLKQALKLREKWVFKPAVGPEQMAHLPEARVPSEIPAVNRVWAEREFQRTGVRPAIPLSYGAHTPPPGALVGPEAADGHPHFHFSMIDGVFQVYEDVERSKLVAAPPGTATDFFSDLHWLLRVTSAGVVRSYTHHRLLLLEHKFHLHTQLNADREHVSQKSAPHRDFYNCRKVDTHVHHSACMHQKHLLRFIKHKLKREPDEVVIFRDGKYLTLREVFESLNLTPYDLCVDKLDVHADRNIFHRFDRFNLKYNPFGQSRLREVFIKQDNLLRGRYLAELTSQVLHDLEASKYQHAEYRVSIYGRKTVEWDTLAAWVVQNGLRSDNNRWMIQIPRLYDVYRNGGTIANFEQLLRNVWQPLFEATADPTSHPTLAVFLEDVSGFDLVDDESKPERRPTKHQPTPREWNTPYSPSFAYWIYYMSANLHTLNRAREARGLNTFSFRPHSGEAGDVDHLAATFMACENIAHGINLRKSPSLQFLYYLAQVGLCMSPLSNNSLFLDYHKNPLPTFFARGLSVSLSTDDPLQIHLTKEPLVEEYSVAAQVWKLSGTDLCEIARSSVLHSGYPHQVKMHWLSTRYWLPGPEGNDIQKTNVPALRLRFRKDCHDDETRLIDSGAARHEARVRAKEEAAARAAQAVD